MCRKTVTHAYNYTLTDEGICSIAGYVHLLPRRETATFERCLLICSNFTSAAINDQQDLYRLRSDVSAGCRAAAHMDMTKTDNN
jgi:hypothetical protein